MTGSHQGYDYVVWTNPMGFRCGYVRVPEDHPAYGKPYDEIPISVHGGLTFSDLIEDPEERAQKFPKAGYWIGFDCGHCFDLPDPDEMDLDTIRAWKAAEKAMKPFEDMLNEIFSGEEWKFSDYKEPEKRIRNDRYVESQCRNVIGQLQEMESNDTARRVEDTGSI